MALVLHGPLPGTEMGQDVDQLFLGDKRAAAVNLEYLPAVFQPQQGVAHGYAADVVGLHQLGLGGDGRSRAKVPFFDVFFQNISQLDIQRRCTISIQRKIFHDPKTSNHQPLTI